MCLRNTNASDNDQLQGWPRLQGSIEISCHKSVLVKYKNSRTHCSKVISKVKVF